MDNHDVERIYTKLQNKAHYAPVHVLLYTLPGVPSVYYGSEFGIEGKKEKFSDASLRPALSLEDYKDALTDNACIKLTAALGHIRQSSKALSYGDYQQLLLTNRQYAFSRNTSDETAIVTVNNDDSNFVMTVPCGNGTEFYGMLSGEKVSAVNGTICVNVKANSGEIWLTSAGQLFKADPADGCAAGTPAGGVSENAGTPAEGVSEKTGTPAGGASEKAETNAEPQTETVQVVVSDKTGQANESVPTNKTAADAAAAAGETAAQAGGAAAETAKDEAHEAMNRALDEAFERGKIAGLQEAILAIMEKNGNVTDRMRQDVYDNVYHDSLVNWVKSFR